MLIELGTKQDIDSWMSLVEKVKDAFPGLETKEETFISNNYECFDIYLL